MRQLQVLKRAVKAVIGKDFFPKIDGNYRNQRFGSLYGGWNVIVDILTPSSIVYSFGIGEDATFDINLIDQLGVTVHAFDPTPKSIEWVCKQNFPSKFVLHEYGLADFDGMAHFYPPRNPNHVSHSLIAERKGLQQAITIPVKRLGTILEELGHSKVDLLKVDIEGAEYKFIEDLAAGPIRPTQVLVEFHHRFPTIGISKSKQAIAELREIGYQLFSVSDSGEEFGFVLSASPE